VNVRRFRCERTSESEFMDNNLGRPQRIIRQRPDSTHIDTEGRGDARPYGRRCDTRRPNGGRVSVKLELTRANDVAHTMTAWRACRARRRITVPGSQRRPLPHRRGSAFRPRGMPSGPPPRRSPVDTASSRRSLHRGRRISVAASRSCSTAWSGRLSATRSSVKRRARGRPRFDRIEIVRLHPQRRNVSANSRPFRKSSSC